MNLADFIIVALIVGGIGFMLYRTMWKKKSFCPGCDSCSVASHAGGDKPGCCSGR